MALNQDHPDVMIFPPVIPASALVAMLLLHWLWPLHIPHRQLTFVMGAATCVLSIGCVAWGRITLVKAGTNVSPLKSTSVVVTGGPFRFTRNPMYVGITAFIFGVSLLVGTWWGVIVLLPATLGFHYGVVLREERYLERKFGEPYLKQKKSVRRYL